MEVSVTICICLFRLKRLFGNRVSNHSLHSFVMLPDFLYVVAMLEQLSTSYPGKFFAYAVRMFFIRYAEGAYYDAAVWGRRVGEVYCKVILDVFGKDLGDEFHGLYELIREMPDWVWPYSGYEHLDAYGEGDHGRWLGMHLSSVRVWEDLDILRKYGNSGAHASSEYLSGGKLSPSPQVVVCVIRVALSFTCWYRRIRMTDSAALARYRSKL